MPRVLLLTALLLSATPVLAQSGDMSLAAARQRMADLQNPGPLVRQWSDEMGRYNAAMVEAESLVLFVDQGAKQAIAFARAHSDAATVDAWSGPWRAQVDAQIAALNTDVAATPFPDALALRLAGLDPVRGRGFLAMRVDLPKARDHIVSESTAFAAAMGDDVVKSAAGDAQAQQQLANGLLAGNRTLIEAENAVLEVTIDTSASDNPQNALARSIHASNQVMIEVIAAGEAGRRGEPIDKPALARRVRSLLDEAKADAARIPALATATESKTMNALSEHPGLADHVASAMSSFGASADIETQIDIKMAAIADQLDQGVEPLRTLSTTTGLDPLIDQRMALAKQRQADLGQ